MTSADPTVTDPMNPQGWNRYSYVGNDPLAFTDPNGFSWLSSFFHSVTNFFRSNPIARAILQIGATLILAAVLAPLVVAGTIVAGAAAAAAAAGGSAIATGLSGGNFGQILRASAIAGATAFAFNAVGDFTGHNPSFGTSEYAENVAGHALVGCGSSVASGGSCQSGALSAGVSAAAGPIINTPNQMASLVRNAVVGGLASVAGGGKFANGAITGAFGYMFNSAASCLQTGVCTRADIREGAISNADGVFGLLFPVVGAVRAFLFSAAADGVTVFAGHGIESAFTGTTTVPEGVALTLPGRAGVEIPDALGRLIEAGDWGAIVANSRYAGLMEGSQTFLPGAQVPNLILRPAAGLTTLSGSTTVAADTQLSTLLSSARGVCIWAACRLTP